MESILGQMEENMKVNGKKENSMEKENTYLMMVLQELVFGKREKDKNG